MRQISLLNGVGDHVLRPDRVYATGVLSPMTGFRPGEAVMTTAQRFTQGPYTGMNLGGLRGVGARVAAWWQGVKTRAAITRASASAAHATPGMPSVAAQPVVISQHQIAPMAAYGETFGPASNLPMSMTSRAYGQSASLPAYAAEAATKTTMMAWRGVRWPWG